MRFVPWEESGIATVLSSVGSRTRATGSLWLGNTEEPLDWLERAYADRSHLLLFLLGPHPAFDALRGGSRFRELRKKAGFVR